jgi:hypothetical protein
VSRHGQARRDGRPPSRRRAPVAQSAPSAVGASSTATLACSWRRLRSGRETMKFG